MQRGRQISEADARQMRSLFHPGVFRPDQFAHRLPRKFAQLIARNRAESVAQRRVVITHDVTDLHLAEAAGELARQITDERITALFVEQTEKFRQIEVMLQLLYRRALV